MIVRFVRMRVIGSYFYSVFGWLSDECGRGLGRDGSYLS